MAMTMKTVGLLLWASMNLDWADHVFKVGDPARNPHAAQQPHILPLSITKTRFLTVSLIGTGVGRHRHIRELAADGAGMHMPVLGSYEGCGTEPGAHVRLQTPSIARHSSQTHCTRALILFLRRPMCFVPCTLCRFSQHRTMCRRSLELFTVSATRLLVINCVP